MSGHVPTADGLMANPEWAALFGDIHPSHLRMIAEDQAERAAAYSARMAAADALPASPYSHVADCCKDTSCACMDRDSVQCAAIRYGMDHWGEPCECTCHQRDDDGATP